MSDEDNSSLPSALTSTPKRAKKSLEISDTCDRMSSILLERSVGDELEASVIDDEDRVQERDLENMSVEGDSMPELTDSVESAGSEDEEVVWTGEINKVPDQGLGGLRRCSEWNSVVDEWGNDTGFEMAEFVRRDSSESGSDETGLYYLQGAKRNCRSVRYLDDENGIPDMRCEEEHIEGGGDGNNCDVWCTSLGEYVIGGS